PTTVAPTLSCTTAPSRAPVSGTWRRTSAWSSRSLPAPAARRPRTSSVSDPAPARPEVLNFEQRPRWGSKSPPGAFCVRCSIPAPARTGARGAARCSRKAGRGARSATETGQAPDPSADHSTDDRTDHRDPGVPPVGGSFARDGQQRVRDTWPQITGRVDRVSRGATEGQTDGEDQQTDQKGRQTVGEQCGQVGTSSRHRTFVKTDPDHTQEQHRGTDDLGDEVGHRVAHGRGGTENTEFGGLVVGDAPVREIDQVHQNGTGAATGHLRQEITGYLRPGEVADGCQTEGDGGVDVTPTDVADDVDRHGHRHAPTEGHHDPAPLEGLGPGEGDPGHDTAAEEGKDR